MKTGRTTCLAAGLVLASSTIPPALLAQGPLSPPGSPAPSMRSLQEIWDRVGAIEAQTQALHNTIEIQRAQIAALQNQSTTLFYAGGGSLPWTIVTLAEGAHFRSTSLAFGPDGLPAISYVDEFDCRLVFARMGAITPAR